MYTNMYVINVKDFARFKELDGTDWSKRHGRHSDLHLNTRSEPVADRHQPVDREPPKIRIIVAGTQSERS